MGRSLSLVLSQRQHFSRLVGMRELRLVRVVSIPHTAVAVPRRATRMAYSERTAEDEPWVMLQICTLPAGVPCC